MAKQKSIFVIMLIIFFLAAVGMMPLPSVANGTVSRLAAGASVSPAAPAPAAPASDASLDICLNGEPPTLFVYGQEYSGRPERAVWQSIYAGPYDSVSFAYQPVLLKSMPTPENGAVVTAEVQVTIGSKVLDYSTYDVVEIGPTTVVDLLQLDGSVVTHDFAANPSASTVQSTVTYSLVTPLMGLSWEDGVPLTSDDVLFSWEVAASPDVPYDKWTIERTSAMQKVDNQSWKWVGLPGMPVGSPYDYGVVYPLPAHLYGPGGSRTLTPAEMMLDDEVNRDPLAYGPFEIDEWVAGSHITLSSNEAYFRAGEGLPKFAAAMFLFTSDPLGELVAGNCDIILDDAVYPQATLLDYDAQGYLEIAMATTPSYEHLDFAIQPAAGWNGLSASMQLFQDADIRHAFAYCIDRQAVIDDVLVGAGYFGDTYIAENHPYYPASLATYPFNPAQGRTLLSAAGWVDSNGNGIRDKGGVELSLVYRTRDNQQRRQILPVVASQLKANCGIEAIPDYLSSFTPIQNREYDLSEFTWITGMNPPCNLYMSMNISNYIGYSNPAFDAACQSAVDATQEADRKAYHQQAAQIFSQDLPSLVLFFRAKVAASAPHITGFGVDSTQETLWNIETISAGVEANIVEGGGELSSEADATSYTFPQGAFNQEVRVTHTPLSPGEAPPANPARVPLPAASQPILNGIGHFFTVSAVDALGQPVQPSQPYSLEIHYTDDETRWVYEETLKLFYWDGMDWVIEPSATLDMATNTVSAQPDHFSTWAVLGVKKHWVHLPTIRR